MLIWHRDRFAALPAENKNGNAYVGAASPEKIEMGECSNASTYYGSSDGTSSQDEAQRSDGGLDGTRQEDSSPASFVERTRPADPASPASIRGRRDNAASSVSSLATMLPTAPPASPSGGHAPPASGVGVDPRLANHGASSRAVVLGLLHDLLQALPTANIDQVLASLEPIRRHSGSGGGGLTDTVRLSQLSEASHGNPASSDDFLQRRGSNEECGVELGTAGGNGQRESARPSSVPPKGQRERSSATSVKSADSEAGARRRSSVSSASDREGKAAVASCWRPGRKDGGVGNLPPLPSSLSRSRRPSRGEATPQGRRVGAPKCYETRPVADCLQSRLVSFGRRQKSDEEGTRSPRGSVSQRSLCESKRGAAGEGATKKKSAVQGQNDGAVKKDNRKAKGQPEGNSGNGDDRLPSAGTAPMTAKEIVEKHAEDLREWLGWAVSLGYVPGLYSSAAAQMGTGDRFANSAARHPFLVHLASPNANQGPQDASPGPLGLPFQQVAGVECGPAGDVLSAGLPAAAGARVGAPRRNLGASDASADMGRAQPPNATASSPGKGQVNTVHAEADVSQGLRAARSRSILETLTADREGNASPHSQLPRPKETTALRLQARGVARPVPLFLAAAEASGTEQASSRSDDDSSGPQVTTPLPPIEEEGEDIDVISLPQKLMPVTPKHLLQTPRPAWLKGTPTAAQAAAECRAASAALRQAALEELSRTTPTARDGQNPEARAGDAEDVSPRQHLEETGKTNNACWSGMGFKACGARCATGEPEDSEGSDDASTPRPVPASAVTLEELFPQIKSQRQSCIANFWKLLCSSPGSGTVFSRQPGPLPHHKAPDVFLFFDPGQPGMAPLSRVPPHDYLSRVDGARAHIPHPAEEPYPFVAAPCHPVGFPLTPSYVPLNGNGVLLPADYRIAPFYAYGGPAGADKFIPPASTLAPVHEGATA
ncbi:conserved hypothetical protein [Neospora caninum Liverpool]|nr:conserved hypothetical protein [Neospora caninum Liverpool]CBZ54766.1 conserved hypothetical protein [Neospora caninum Liverpool]|eukprot:XP_003884794.1 conserved hypothetical protein [Neospora caninum Liverpool]